jgi:hypothetical protein
LIEGTSDLKIKKGSQLKNNGSIAKSRIPSSEMRNA